MWTCTPCDPAGRFSPVIVNFTPESVSIACAVPRAVPSGACRVAIGICADASSALAASIPEVPAQAARADMPINRQGKVDLRKVELRMLGRSEEHTSELQSLMRISYAVFCLKQKHMNM